MPEKVFVIKLINVVLPKATTVSLHSPIYKHIKLQIPSTSCGSLPYSKQKEQIS